MQVTSKCNDRIGGGSSLIKAQKALLFGKSTIFNDCHSLRVLILFRLELVFVSHF